MLFIYILISNNIKQTSNIKKQGNITTTFIVLAAYHVVRDQFFRCLGVVEVVDLGEPVEYEGVGGGCCCGKVASVHVLLGTLATRAGCYWRGRENGLYRGLLQFRGGGIRDNWAQGYYVRELGWCLDKVRRDSWL